MLVFPFRVTPDGDIEYAVLRRSDNDAWQGVSGGGERGELPADAARREAGEEAGVPGEARLIELDSMTTVPVEEVAGFLWGSDILVIPEYAFGIEIRNRDLVLSHEHVEVRWVGYETARSLVRWDSNRAALWELNHRLGRASLRR